MAAVLPLTHRAEKLLMKAFIIISLLISATPALSAEVGWDTNKSVHENVIVMEPELQMLLLALLVNKTGRSCEPVVHTYQGGTESGDHYWTIACLNGAKWSVMLADDGYQVMSCAKWEQLSEHSCLASF